MTEPEKSPSITTDVLPTITVEVVGPQGTPDGGARRLVAADLVIRGPLREVTDVAILASINFASLRTMDAGRIRLRYFRSGREALAEAENLERPDSPA